MNFVGKQAEKDPAACLGIIADLQKVADARREDLITSQLNRAQCGLIFGYVQRGAYDEAETLLKVVSLKLTQHNMLEVARVWLVAILNVTGLANSKGLPRPEYAEASIALIRHQPSPHPTSP